MKQNLVSFLLLSLLSLSVCGQTPEDARKELGQLNIPYSEYSFIESARNGDMMAVKLFLAVGIDVNSENGKALVLAVEEGHTEIVGTLLDAGADVNVSGGKALVIAAGSGHIALVKLLLDKGADIYLKTFNGQTALLEAVREGHIEIVKLLLDSGADITLESDDTTVLMEAVREDHIEIVKLLLDKGANGADGGALWVAIQNGRTEFVDLLLDNGADANVKTEYSTALEVAIRGGQPEIIKLLLEKGADANVKDSANETALIMALELSSHWNENKKNIVKILLDQANGIDVNVSNFYGTPALFLAESDIDIEEWLINKGADINARDSGNYGETFLMKQVEAGNVDFVKVLIDKGADINATDTKGNTALIKAVNSSNVEIVTLLLDKGAWTNQRGDRGYTALMQAIMNGNTNIVKLLLDKGADINITGTYGDTALSRARPYPEIAQLLNNAVSHEMSQPPQQEAKTEIQRADGQGGAHESVNASPVGLIPEALPPVVDPSPPLEPTVWDYPVTPYRPGSYGGRGFYFDKNHLGEDMRLSEGSAIRAIGPGKIVHYGPAGGYGELVVAVEHDVGAEGATLRSGTGETRQTRTFLSIYGHLRACETRENSACTNLAVGDAVTATTIIGYVNDHNDDPALDHNGDGKEHLHLGIRLLSAAEAKERDGDKWLRGYESGSNTHGEFSAASVIIPLLQRLKGKPSPSEQMGEVDTGQ